MAKKPAPSSNALQKLMKNAAAAKAFDAHKTDETTYSGGGFTDLPDGMSGIATLTTAELREYEKGDNSGKPYLSLVGVIVSPIEQGGVKTEGLQVRKNLNLFEVTGAYPKSIDQQISTALNELRKLGLDTEGLSIADWPAAMENLVSESPSFKFRTWRPDDKTDPVTKKTEKQRQMIFFDGLAEVSEASDPEVVDETADDTNDEQADESAADNEDVAALAAAADGGDTDAAARLTEIAQAAGIDTDDYPTWAGVAEQLAGSSDEASDEDAVDAWQPEKGELVNYAPVGTKTIKMEVIKIMKTTLDLKEVKSGKVHKAVPYTEEPPTIGGKPKQ
jgi:hypothetical protein